MKHVTTWHATISSRQKLQHFCLKASKGTLNSEVVVQ